MSSSGRFLDDAQATTDDNVQLAIKQIVSGTFDGTLVFKGGNRVCSDCGKPIPAQRLKVNPQAKLCVPCKTIREKK